MPPDIQALWAVLGWNCDRWDRGSPPRSDGLDWRDLSAKRRAAAKELGYTKKLWDADVEEEESSDDDSNDDGVDGMSPKRSSPIE
jgi:hypothetical protein